jgi:RNA polymerase sigma-70 factor, ECF subfamily
VPATPQRHPLGDVTGKAHGDVVTVVNALAHAWPARMPLRRSFAQVAEDHLDDVLRYLLVFTADRGLAEDLAGEAFEKALRRWRRYDPRRAPERVWLCEIARTVALDHFRAAARRRTREERFAQETATWEEEPLGGAFSPELEAALASLSAGEREVIALRIVLDFDAQSAARLLGIGRPACSMRLARALQKLEERIGSHAHA